MTTPTQKWYESRTIWLNVIALMLEVMAIADVFPGGEVLVIYIPGVTALLNIVLRFITATPIEGSSAAADATRLVETALVMPVNATTAQLAHVVSATSAVPSPATAAALIASGPTAVVDDNDTTAPTPAPPAKGVRS